MQKIPEKKQKEIEKMVENFFIPETPALSRRFPFLIPLILLVRRSKKLIQNFFNTNLSQEKNEKLFPYTVARHQSVLRRTLGTSDMRLQEQKVVNLTVASQKLHGVIIPPEKTFSFWDIIGNPSRKNGYVNGMLLSNGKVIEGVGGGLCQMSNFLCWIFLHTDIEIVERHHHSRDVFPDSGRVLPFGSGATNFYNLMDLKIKNISSSPLQISLEITEKYLKGKILSSHPSKYVFSVYEKYHCFVKKNKKYFRYNEIWRKKMTKGENGKKGVFVSDEKIFTNCAPVFYDITDEYIEKNQYILIDMDKK